MDFGMLWFDNNPASNLSQKVDRAAEYYRSKYGSAPTICLVNPKMLTDHEIKDCSLVVKPNPIVLYHHLWIGIADDSNVPGN
ncbi:MAG: hypothetical protein ABFS17_00910 [Chloroflexota bacterium]